MALAVASVLLDYSTQETIYSSPNTSLWDLDRCKYHGEMMSILLLAMMFLVHPADGFEPAKVPRLILLDRDGVVNQDVGSPGVLSPSQLELTPGVADAIAQLHQAGCSIAIITNQSCVGKGLISNEQLDTIQNKLQEMLLAENSNAHIDRLYQCTSTVEDQDSRMKPKPGMIVEALNDFSVDALHCCLIGDTSTDLQAAASANISLRILVATGYGSGLMDGREPVDEGFLCKFPSEVPKMDPSTVPFVYCRNLEHAVHWIFTRASHFS